MKRSTAERFVKTMFIMIKKNTPSLQGVTVTYENKQNGSSSNFPLGTRCPKLLY